MDQNLIEQMRLSYDRAAEERNGRRIPTWKVEERAKFLGLLKREDRRQMLEIGAGPGRDALFFSTNGIDMVCTDLSPEMVRLCRAKGLTAHEMDFWHLDFAAGSFEAVYAQNCLLHVPKVDLPTILASIHGLLRPGGLFFFGVYGGIEQDGVWGTDQYEPKRWFSFYLDEQIRAVVAPWFEEVAFAAIPVPDDDEGMHFQSLTLRRR